jgi:hypothetical protein
MSAHARSVFRIAAAYARATEFHKPRPPIYGKANLEPLVLHRLDALVVTDGTTG